MNEQPETNSSKKPSNGRRFGWVILFLVIFVITAFAEVSAYQLTNLPAGLWFAVLFSAFATLGLWLCFRWLFHWRVIRRLLFGLACLVTLAGLFYAEEDWRGWHDWSGFQREWAAKGEHFDIASYVPPPVPDDQNFAMTPLVYTSYGYILDRTAHQIVPAKTNWNNRLQMDYDENNSAPSTNGDWARGLKMDFSGLQNYYRILAAKTNLFLVPAQPGSPAADVLLALGRFASTIEELREDAKLPDSRFPLEYDKDEPAAIVLPHLAALKRAGLVLQLRALAEADTGQNDQALADLKLIERLAESMRTEPIMISQLVRIALVKMEIQAVWEGLADRRWSDGQLAELDAGLAKLDFLESYKLAMHGEIGLDTGVIHYLHDHPAQYENLFDNFDSNQDPSRADSIAAGLMYFHLIPNGWFYQSQLACARAMEEYYLPVANGSARVFVPEVVRRGEDQLAEMKRHPRPFNLLERQLVPALGNAARKFAYGQSAVDLARVAIALERHRLARGKYPDSLAALEPQFVSSVPDDVMGGQPLHYRLAADGQFVLYSVGWNGTDDGGVVALRKAPDGGQEIKEGDWVWRYGEMKNAE